MMNHSGALLALALDHNALLRSLHESEDRLRQAALHDHLTGLPNRALFTDRLRQAWQRSIAEPEHQFAVLFLDLDGFKQVNDSLGHAAGDRLLVHVARRLSALLRSGDTAARLGGDEFVILLDGVDLPHGPRHVDERIRASLRRAGDAGRPGGARRREHWDRDVHRRLAAPEDLLRHAEPRCTTPRCAARPPRSGISRGDLLALCTGSHDVARLTFTSGSTGAAVTPPPCTACRASTPTPRSRPPAVVGEGQHPQVPVLLVVGLAVVHLEPDHRVRPSTATGSAVIVNGWPSSTSQIARMPA
jgi:GGDEF domain-containing protein